MSMTKMIQEVEQKIIGQFVKDALEAGYRLAVSLERGYDLDEMLIGCRDYEKIMAAIMEGEKCHVFVQSADGNLVEDGQIVSDGWVYFVLCNEGWDCISDYTTNLEKLLSKAISISEQYAD